MHAAGCIFLPNRILQGARTNKSWELCSMRLLTVPQPWRHQDGEQLRIGKRCGCP